MASPQSFRSAFNGFNKEDVVHYLEYLNSKHTSQIEQLQAEISRLEKELDTRPNVNFSESLDLSKKVAELQETIAVKESQNVELTSQISDLQNELEQVRSEKAAARHQTDMELETYRRAERTERMARERAEQVYQQTNGVLAEATAKVDEASSQISAISDHVMSQLDLLREAVCSSKRALSDAADGLGTLQSSVD